MTDADDHEGHERRSARPDRLDHDSVGAIIRRAAELDQERSAVEAGLAPGVDRFALEEAADEVGISPHSVRRAMAEHDAGVLAPPDPSRSIIGPARARSLRTVDLPVDTCTRIVSRWLEAQLFEVHRRRPAEIEWRRRSDLIAKFRRRFDPAKRLRLTSADGVIVSVVDDGDDRSIVRLEADLSITRQGLKTGVVAIPAAAGPILGIGAGLILDHVALLVAGFPVGAALGGTGLYVSRRTLTSALAEAQRVLDLFLDDLDRRS